MARHGENIYKRRDGRYEGRYVIGKTCGGKTRFGYVYGRQYAEVKRALLMKKAEWAQKSAAANGSCQDTLAEWLFCWMENELLGSVKVSSYQKHEDEYHMEAAKRDAAYQSDTEKYEQQREMRRSADRLAESKWKLAEERTQLTALERQMKLYQEELILIEEAAQSTEDELSWIPELKWKIAECRKRIAEMDHRLKLSQEE